MEMATECLMNAYQTINSGGGFSCPFAIGDVDRACMECCIANRFFYACYDMHNLSGFELI